MWTTIYYDLDPLRSLARWAALRGERSGPALATLRGGLSHTWRACGSQLERGTMCLSSKCAGTSEVTEVSGVAEVSA